MRYSKIIISLVISSLFSCNRLDRNPEFSLKIIGEDSPSIQLLVNNAEGLAISAVQPKSKKDLASQKISSNGVILLDYKLTNKNNRWIFIYASKKDISILDGHKKWKFVDKSGENISMLLKSETHREILVVMR